MKRVIYKYVINPSKIDNDFRVGVNLPVAENVDAQLLDAGEQNGALYIWVSLPVDEIGEGEREVNLLVVPTGAAFSQTRENGIVLTPFKTVHMKNGLVFHIFF